MRSASDIPDKRRFRLKYFGLVSNRLYDRSIDRLRRDGYRYVVVNNFRTDRFRITRKDSEEAARAAEYFHARARRGDASHAEGARAARA